MSNGERRHAGGRKSRGGDAGTGECSVTTPCHWSQKTARVPRQTREGSTAPEGGHSGMRCAQAVLTGHWVK